MSGEAARMVSHSAIYGAGNIARKIVAFIMLPIYTRYLTPADYGAVELFTLLLSVVEVFFGMRMGQALFRYYFAADSKAERDEVVTTVLAVGAGVSALGAMAVAGFSEPLARVLFGEALYVHLIPLIGLLLVTQGVEDFGLNFIRAHQRPGLFLALSLGKLALQVSLNLYLVVWLELHVAGVVLGNVLSSGAIALFGVGYTLRYTRLRPSRRHLRVLLAFSYPFWISGLFQIYISFGDRYFLRVFTDMAQVGIYALAYRFGFLLVEFTWGTFANIWDTQRYRILERGDAREIYQMTFQYFALFTILMGLGIAMFVGDVIHVMAAPAFWPAADIAPVLVLAYILYVWTLFSNFGLLLAEKTRKLAIASGITAVVISVGYLALIPLLGALGAALATLIALSVELTWVHAQARREYDMGLPWARVLSALALAVVLYAIAEAGPTELVWSLLLRGALVGVFLVAVLFSPLLPAEQRGLVRSLIRRPARLRGVAG
ncbi:lipopolysaccharide biosynthesis protein [Arhodomonas sp. KWT2]|uniref:lipopolysaccharide biosynthesis protein n=1 Tax=Arhodomonas sp. KWT2 TaxID=3344194 RepID=UPI0035BFF9DD